MNADQALLLLRLVGMSDGHSDVEQRQEFRRAWDRLVRQARSARINRERQQDEGGGEE